MDPLVPGRRYGLSLLDGEALRHIGPVRCLQVTDRRATFRDHVKDGTNHRSADLLDSVIEAEGDAAGTQTGADVLPWRP